MSQTDGRWSMKPYIPLLIVFLTAVYGYGILNARVDALEKQGAEQQTLISQQASLLQTIAVDVAVIRTKVDLAIK